MALLDTSPKKTRDISYDYSHLYSWSTGALLQHWTRREVIYEWLCDDTGGETSHAGTYGVGGLVLEESGPEVPRTENTGVYREVYRTPGTLVIP
jgi:hypothetical protein